MQQFLEDDRLIPALIGVGKLKVRPDAWADIDAVIDAFRVLRPRTFVGDALEASVSFARGDMARTCRLFESMENWERVLPEMAAVYATALAATGSPEWERWALRGIEAGGSARVYCEGLVSMMSPSAFGAGA